VRSKRSDELTQAVQDAANRCRSLLAGISAAAPEASVLDQCTALTELTAIERRLQSPKLKRRTLLPDGETEESGEPTPRSKTR
jgi:hypothetical protein